VKLTDTHCHLNFRNYQDDLPQVLSRAKKIGIQRILAPGIDLVASHEVLRIAHEYPDVYAAVGVHPNSAVTWEETSAEELASLLSSPKVVAIGEIGLDYYRDRAPKNLQVDVLNRQLEIATQQKLPVILHVRNKSEDDRSCIEDLLSILKHWVDKSKLKEKKGYQPGVIHSFSGNLAESRRALDMGFFIGITGAVTYKNADILREVVLETPLERLLVETDGPFITPHPFRGKRNEPAHVRYIVDKISAVKGLDPEQISNQTSLNAGSLFGWEQFLD
jgi:TatD DNase family protein